MDITFEEIESIVDKCLEILINEDRDLLINDVSERAITHKLAEHLQKEISKLPEPIGSLKVDCEYNRNVAGGAMHPKMLDILTISAREEIQKLLEIGNGEIVEELLSNSDSFKTVSTYPDIIVHHRTINDKNLLIVELKKTTNQTGPAHDITKLESFTSNSDKNIYKYKFGIFILLETGKPFEQLRVVEKRWFFRDEN